MQYDTNRVASSEISGGKLPEIYSNLSGNFLPDICGMSLITCVNQLFPSQVLQSAAVK